MAHVQQQEFCRKIYNQFEGFFKNKFVLDIGSLDINGNNQEYFQNCHYLGVDIAPGRNVDIVSKGHELGFSNNTFDIIISTECFEHDQYYINTIQNIYRMLKPGGLFIFTCATTGRAEHGTRRTTPEDAPLLQSDVEWSDYYKNLTENDIRKILDVDTSFTNYQFSTNDESYDLYFYGFKSGEYLSRDDYSFLISNKPRELKTFIQLFFDQGSGYREEDSIKSPVVQNTDLQQFIFDLSDKANIQTLRLDPLNDSCVIQIEKLTLIHNDEAIDLSSDIASNSCTQHGNNYFFEVEDSQISFNLSSHQLTQAQKLIAEIRYSHMGRDAVHICAKQIQQDLIFQKEEIEIYAKQIQQDLIFQKEEIEKRDTNVLQINHLLEKKQNELMELSDWATSIKKQLDSTYDEVENIKASFWYKVIHKLGLI